MTYRGHVIQGSIVLDDEVLLPEGVSVEVVVHAPSEVPGEPALLTLRERLAPFIGIANDLPADASENHDAHLYGTPGP